MSEQDLIIGLAGHIDHGKTSLIRALNGFDGDETKQEKERGITLDLSFSNLSLNTEFGAKNIAFIDVPGHEKLVKTMIAGAFGIDILLLVIAADDGVMPQSIEHLQIAKNLGIENIAVVISKVDLVDSEMLSARKNEICDFFKAQNLKLSGIFEFSNKNSEQYTGTIIEFLKNASKSHKNDYKMIALYVDRAFSIKGAGCVVTGTLLSGQINVGDKVFVCELGKEFVVKNIQIHNADTQAALPRHRVALNLAGAQGLERGFFITQKGFMRGSNFIDVKFNVFDSKKLVHNAKCSLHIGSKKASVRVQILNDNFATLQCDEQLFALFGQFAILRLGDESIAGIKVLNPISDPIKKAAKIEILNALDSENFALAFGLLAKNHKHGFGVVCATQRFALTHAQAVQIFENVDSVFFDKRDLVAYDESTTRALANDVEKVFAKKDALITASSLQNRYKWASIALLQSILDNLLSSKKIKKNSSFFVSLNNEIKNIDEFLQDKILQILTQQGNSPSAPYNIYDELLIDKIAGDNALKSLTKNQKATRLAHNLFVESMALNGVLNLMREIIKTDGFIEISNFKNHLNLSRKYLINYLDYLDNFSDIQKQGNRRIFKFQAQK